MGAIKQTWHSVSFISAIYVISVSSVRCKEFAKVIKSLTQLEEIMFPHLDSMGLGFGVNIFLNITGSMC